MNTNERDALMALVAKWHKEADEIAANNWACNSYSIRARADELEQALAAQPAAGGQPAASVDVEGERQRFEAWIDTEVHPITTVERASGKAGDKRYMSPTTAVAWLAWQAALAQQETE